MEQKARSVCRIAQLVAVILVCRTIVLFYYGKSQNLYYLNFPTDDPRSIESSRNRNASDSIDEFGIIRTVDSTTDTNPNEGAKVYCLIIILTSYQVTYNSAVDNCKSI